MQRGLKYLTGVLLVELALYGSGVAAQTVSSQDKAEAGRGVYADDLQRSRLGLQGVEKRFRTLEHERTALQGRLTEVTSEREAARG